MKKAIFLSLFLSVFLITSCKKYPDGPWISIEGKKKRICHDWNVSYFSVDGYDSTSALISKPYYGIYAIRDNKDNGIAVYYFLPSSPILTYCRNGTCEFTNSDKSIHIHFNPTSVSNTFGPYRADDVTWEIRRLTSKDLWLKTIYNGREYFVKFKN